MKKFLLWVVLPLLLLYTIAGFWIVPSIASKKIPSLLKKELGSDISVGKIAFNPYSMRLIVPDIHLKDTNGSDILGLEALVIDFSPLSSLLHLSIDFDEVRFKKPRVHILAKKNGSYNFSPILKHLEKDKSGAPSAAPKEKTGTIPTIRVEQFAIESANLLFEDLSVPEPVKIEATNYNFGIENLSTIPSDYGFIAYEIETKSSGIVRSFSKISLNPFKIEGQLTVDGGRFDKIDHYLKEFANLSIKEGTAELYLAYRASQTPHGVAAKIEEGRFDLHGFRLDDPVSTPVTIGRFAVDGIETAWPERTIHIGSVVLRDTKFYASMDRKGKLSFEKWLKNSGKAKKSDTNASASSQAPSKPWHITVDETKFRNIHTAFETPAYRLDADHTHTIGAVRSTRTARSTHGSRP